MKTIILGVFLVHTESSADWLAGRLSGAALLSAVNLGLCSKAALHGIFFLTDNQSLLFISGHNLLFRSMDGTKL